MSRIVGPRDVGDGLLDLPGEPVRGIGDAPDHRFAGQPQQTIAVPGVLSPLDQLAPSLCRILDVGDHGIEPPRLVALLRHKGIASSRIVVRSLGSRPPAVITSTSRPRSADTARRSRA